MRKLIALLIFMVVVIMSKAQMKNDTLTIKSENLRTQIVFMQNDQVEIFTYNVKTFANKTTMSTNAQMWFDKVWRITTPTGKETLRRLASNRGLAVPEELPSFVGGERVYNL